MVKNIFRYLRLLFCYFQPIVSLLVTAANMLLKHYIWRFNTLAIHSLFDIASCVSINTFYWSERKRAFKSPGSYHLLSSHSTIMSTQSLGMGGGGLSALVLGIFPACCILLATAFRFISTNSQVQIMCKMSWYKSSCECNKVVTDIWTIFYWF